MKSPTKIEKDSTYRPVRQGVKEDLTGRDHLVSNVMFNWGGHFVFIASGFILPRMIDHRLGQDLLGIWDLAWSLVSYFTMVSAGIASSVNRYVARYRVAGDISGVNATVCSALFLLSLSGFLIFGLTIGVSTLLPNLFGSRLGDDVAQAQWVVFFLGTSMAVETCFQPFNGVLTGCHRWGLRNLIESGWYTITIIGQIVLLLMSANLSALALIYLIGTILAYLTRVIAAYRICRGLRIHPSLIKMESIRDQFTFGAKTLIPKVSQLLLNQTTSIMIAATLGPAMLALYTRPRSLVRQANTLVRKMALVLIPTASSLQSRSDMDGVREILVKSVRYSCYLVLPIVILLVIFGGPILEFWMGPKYADGWLVAILAVGFLVVMVQTPVWPILVGLNAHGRAGLAEFLASLCSAILVILGLNIFKWGLIDIAVAVSVPLTIMNLTYLPFLIHRRIGQDMKQYVLSVIVVPVIHLLPFVTCLVVSRLVYGSRPFLGLAVGGAAGVVFLTIVYWRYVLPEKIKDWVIHQLRKVLRLTGLNFGTDMI